MHTHTEECWEPNSGCDMGRNEKYVGVVSEAKEHMIDIALLSTCKQCGRPPTIKTEWVVHGHGDTTRDAVYVECSCGMRTRTIDGYMAPSVRERRKIAIQIWNASE